MHSAATRPPVQHLRPVDPCSPAAAVRSSPSLEEKQLFTSDFSSQSNRTTSLHLQMGPLLKPLELQPLMLVSGTETLVSVQQCLAFGDQAKQSSAPLEDCGLEGSCLRDLVQSRVSRAEFKELSDWWKTDEDSRKKQDCQLESCRRGQWDDREHGSDGQERN